MEKVELDLSNDLFRVTIAREGPDDVNVIATIDATGFTATTFSGKFYVHHGDQPAPRGDAVPAPIHDALERARAEGKLVLVDFFAEWCGPCKRMEAEVYSDPRVAAVLAERYVLLKVDTDEYPAAGKPYRVTGIPDARLLAADGRQVGRIFGFQPVEAVLELLAAAEKNAGLTPLDSVPAPAAVVANTPVPTPPPEDAPPPVAAKSRTVLQVEGMT